MKRFQIFGERCSGTNYLEALLKHNFGEERVIWDFGWKHWYVNYATLESVDTQDVVFIVITRNVFDWIRSFYRQPHHLTHTHKTLAKFMLHEVVSRDANGIVDLPEPNIFHLRANKIHNFLGIANYVPHFVLIRYEDLILDPKSWIKMISSTFDIHIINNDIVDTIDSYKGLGRKAYEPLKYDEFTTDEMDIIRCNLDRNAESLCGYDTFQ